MPKKIRSLGLRGRVVAAVSGGMSRRQAAECFGGSAASAIRWCRRERENGGPASYKRGGDRWSVRIDAHKSPILSLVDETCDITLAELQAQLAECGLCFSIGSLWRYFARRKITWKEKTAHARRAGSPGRLDAARGVVRRPTRPRS